MAQSGGQRVKHCEGGGLLIRLKAIVACSVVLARLALEARRALAASLQRRLQGHDCVRRLI